MVSSWNKSVPNRGMYLKILVVNMVFKKRICKTQSYANGFVVWGFREDCGQCEPGKCQGKSKEVLPLCVQKAC